MSVAIWQILHFFLDFQNTIGCQKQSKPIIHQWSEMYMQTTGQDAVLTCRSTGPHEHYWIGPNGQPIDIKSQKYQVSKSDFDCL